MTDSPKTEFRLMIDSRFWAENGLHDAYIYIVRSNPFYGPPD